jgi:hypothetical protein
LSLLRSSIFEQEEPCFCRDALAILLHMRHNAGSVRIEKIGPIHELELTSADVERLVGLPANKLEIKQLTHSIRELRGMVGELAKRVRQVESKFVTSTARRLRD